MQVAGNAKGTSDPPKGPPGGGINKKRKMTRAQKACPNELKDFNLKVAQGSIAGPICWGYNLKTGCAKETSIQNGGQRCMRGFHVCANCHKLGHSVVSCRALKQKP